jgi:enoyl-CoA hydratase/carnithine racemase
MVRDLAAVLKRWSTDPRVEVVGIRGQGREGPFGAFSAGGDIRFFHQAALAGDQASLDAFFTEEYQLNHLVHHYPKPFAAFMDGIVFGGGMGISQGARCRIVTERTKMAMPETVIGLFPDVGQAGGRRHVRRARAAPCAGLAARGTPARDRPGVRTGQRR